MDDFNRTWKIGYQDPEHGRFEVERKCPQSWIIGRKTIKVVCLEGALWLTKKGDPADFLLKAGESLHLSPGHWVVEALDKSLVKTTIKRATPERYADRTFQRKRMFPAEE